MNLLLLKVKRQLNFETSVSWVAFTHIALVVRRLFQMEQIMEKASCLTQLNNGVALVRSENGKIVMRLIYKCVNLLLK